MSIKKHIPNTITCCNLVSGCVATYMAFGGQWEAALLFIILGAVFDFFDGMSARLLHVSSPIGKELDSLADDITFGLAPSAMLFNFLEQHRDQLCCNALPYVAFIMAAFSALRLAKFNLDERQATSFIGVPTPANALFWGALLVGCGEAIAAVPYGVYGVVVGLLVASWLLVAEIPLFALKFKQWGWRGNEVKYIFLLSCLPLLVVFRVSGIALIIAWYVVLSAVTARRQR